MSDEAKVPVYEWFDPYNPEHLRAYRRLMDHGMWPEGFIPDNVDMTSGWQYALASKIADAHITDRIGYDRPREGKIPLTHEYHDDRELTSDDVKVVTIQCVFRKEDANEASGAILEMMMRDRMESCGWLCNISSYIADITAEGWDIVKGVFKPGGSDSED